MRIDLSADVGEGEDDLPLFRWLTSVNIACGAHAGDPDTMDRSVAEAAGLSLVVGAHPSYPDREGFGRRAIATPPPELHRSLIDQISALADVAARHGVRLAHVKPHGALYNQAAVDPTLAGVVAEAVRDVDARLRLVGIAGSALLDAGRAVGLSVVAEGYADRRYRSDGTLAPRAMPGALMDDPLHASQQALAIASGNPVDSVDGIAIAVEADTICLHADTPGAVGMAERVHASLVAAGVQILPIDA